jgi:predicted nucleic acid-binding protein
VTRYVIDTKLYIAADRDRAKAEELIAFYSAFLPSTYLHAAVVQELLLGAIDARRGRQIQEAYIAPFERRGRIVTPTYQTWKRSGELIGALMQRRLVTPGTFARSLVNDAVLAASCREFGLTLVTANVRDFSRLRQVERFEFVSPWPGVQA